LGLGLRLGLAAAAAFYPIAGPQVWSTVRILPVAMYTTWGYNQQVNEYQLYTYQYKISFNKDIRNGVDEF